MDIKEMVMDLNEMVSKGKILEAFDKYYADDVVMQENNDTPRVGKELNRTYEETFASGVVEMHDIRVVNMAHGDGVAIVEWVFDVTHKEWGRVARNQVAVQTWKDGKIVNERFYYSK